MAIPINPFKYQVPNGGKLFQKDQDIAIRNIFKNEIKGSFLTRLRHRIEDSLGGNLRKYYPSTLTMENSLSGNTELWEIDICKHIIGLHNSNTIFMNNDSKQKLLDSYEYENKLTQEAIDNIKLRQYGSVFFRNKQIVAGDRFLYFHTPYYLFVLCMRMEEILYPLKERFPLYSLFAKISNMGLSALSLLEDNFGDNTYPICRATIELFGILLTLYANPNALDKYFKLVQIEAEKTPDTDYSPEFYEMYNSRLRQQEDRKDKFVHFGWVDDIPNYHSIVTRKDAYSLYGIIDYLKRQKQFGDLDYEVYHRFYKRCHSYSHANIKGSYPLIAFFDVSIMLYNTITLSYELLCNALNLPKEINGIDVLKKLSESYINLIKQYEQISMDKLINYYSDKN